MSVDKRLQKALMTLRPIQPTDAPLKRLPRLIQSVWRKLPARDKVALSGLIYFTLHKPNSNVPTAGTVWIDEQTRNRGDNVSWTTENVSIKGIDGDYYRISFAVDIESRGYSDTHLCCIIAHELAHAILRHPQTVPCIGASGKYTDEQIEDLKRWNEDLVNLQLWKWGFKDELRAQHQYNPQLSPRWWPDPKWATWSDMCLNVLANEKVSE